MWFIIQEEPILIGFVKVNDITTQFFLTEENFVVSNFLFEYLEEGLDCEAPRTWDEFLNLREIEYGKFGLLGDDSCCCLSCGFFGDDFLFSQDADGRNAGQFDLFLCSFGVIYLGKVCKWYRLYFL